MSCWPVRDTDPVEELTGGEDPPFTDQAGDLRRKRCERDEVDERQQPKEQLQAEAT